MTQLQGHLPSLPKQLHFELTAFRRPPLTPQIGWMRRAARAERYKDRTMFIKFTNFKIVSRQADGGPAELLRLVLCCGGIRYENEVIPQVDWKALIQKTPYGCLPVLWVNHMPYGEPNAIVRHMASHLGLLGEDEEEGLVIETVLLQVEKLRDGDVTQRALMELSQNRPDDNAELLLEQLLPANFVAWDERIDKSAGPYMVASGLSLADLAIFDFVTQYRKLLPLDRELSKNKNLEYLVKIVPSHGRLSDYPACS